MRTKLLFEQMMADLETAQALAKDHDNSYKTELLDYLYEQLADIRKTLNNGLSQEEFKRISDLKLAVQASLDYLEQNTFNSENGQQSTDMISSKFETVELF